MWNRGEYHSFVIRLLEYQHPVTSWHSIRMCQSPLKASVTLIQTHTDTQTHINTRHHHLPTHITAYPHTKLPLYSAGPAVVLRPLVGSDGYLCLNPHLFVIHSLPVRSRISSSFILPQIVVEVIRLLTPAISFSILCCLLSSSVTCSVGWKNPLMSITQLVCSFKERININIYSPACQPSMETPGKFLTSHPLHSGSFLVKMEELNSLILPQYILGNKH